MICKDCLHYEPCKNGFLPFEFDEKVTCRSFANKSEWVHLPCKPLPLLKDDNPDNLDVYCPSCGENLSGHYSESPIDIVVCFNCGVLLDITKAVNGESAEKGLAERNKEE